jgi:hypothetical protein
VMLISVVVCAFLYLFVIPWAVIYTFGVAVIVYHPIVMIIVWLLVFVSIARDELRSRCSE